MIKGLFNKNYAKRIAGALNTFVQIKTDLMEANDEINDQVTTSS